MNYAYEYDLLDRSQEDVLLDYLIGSDEPVATPSYSQPAASNPNRIYQWYLDGDSSIGSPMFVLDDVSAGFAGTLWFDANGNGSLADADDVKIADLSNSSVTTGFSHLQLLLV
jgi:hypothetical protein